MGPRFIVFTVKIPCCAYICLFALCAQFQFHYFNLFHRYILYKFTAKAKIYNIIIPIIFYDHQTITLPFLMTHQRNMRPTRNTRRRRRRRHTIQECVYVLVWFGSSIAMCTIFRVVLAVCLAVKLCGPIEMAIKK